MMEQAHDDLLASKLCQLIATLAVKQEITYDEQQSLIIVAYLANVAKQSHTWLLVDVLRTLSYVLVDAAAKISNELRKQVVEVGLPLAKLNDADAEIRRQAICVIGNLCIKSGSSLATYYPSMYEVMYENFDWYAKQVFTVVNMVKVC